MPGIEGNGQSQLLECITGLRQPQSMCIKLKNKEIKGGPNAFLRSGIAHIPEDRNAMGLVATMPISDNLILGYQDTNEYSAAAFCAERRLKSRLRRCARSFR